MKSRAAGMQAVAMALALSSCAPEYVVWRGRSRDRASEIRVVESSRRQRVVVDGRAQPAHAAIGVDGLALAAGHIAYPARDGSSWRIFLDGRPTSAAWDGVGAVALSVDGHALAYAVQRGPRWFVVREGNVSEAYDEILALGFDADRCVYAARRGGQARVYADGAPPSQPWSEIRDLEVSPLSYVGVDAPGEHFVTTASVSDAFPAIVEKTADGFVARAGHQERIVFAFGQRVGVGQIHLLATASRHFAYVSLEPVGDVVVHDGHRDDAHYERIESLSLSPDGEHVGYVARGGKRAVVVVDGQSVAAADWATAPVFAAHGNAFAFVGSMGAGAFVRGPGVAAAFDVVLDDSLVWSDDGAHWAIVAGYDSVQRLYVVIDGKPRMPFDLDEFLATRHKSEGGARARAILRGELMRAK